MLTFFLSAGGFIKDFVLLHWKWLVPLIAIASIFFWTKNHYYDLGRDTERAAWEKKVFEERERNRVLTQQLTASVNSFALLAAKEEEQRVTREVIHENRINTIVQEKPVYSQCLVDQEVIDSQNALKALGPAE